MKSLDDYILGISDNLNFEDYENYKNISLIKHDNIKSLIEKRSRDSHKGTYGKIGMLSGSKGMAGAAVLNLNAALRSGSGLVKGCIPDSIYTVVESMSLEAITYPFCEEDFCVEKLNNELIEFSDVIATGSGCTNLKNYKEMLLYLIENTNKPLVIDAEGINKLSFHMLKNHKQNIVLTPHHGEMAKLIKEDINYVRNDILEKSAEFANKYNVYLVLKGPRTVITCPNGKIFINTTGNPGMATAGSGDVLTGIIASFIGQNIEIANALRLAVYVHSLAGDIAAKEVGEHSLIAGDLIKFLPQALKSI